MDSSRSESYSAANCAVRATWTFRIILLMLGVLGGLAIILATHQHGAGLTNDSVSYVAMARHIENGEGILNYNGRPVSIWPPLYPAVLSAISILTGVDPASSAGAVNALILGLTVYIVGLLALRYMPRFPIVALAVAMHTAIAIPLTYVGTMTWSEPLFILLLALYLLISDRYLSRPGYTRLVVAACLVALLCLTRYIGLVFIPVGLAIILLFGAPRIASRLRHALVFVLISGIPIGAWALRNHALTGTFFGGRSPSAYSLSECITLTRDAIENWYLPRALAEHQLILLAALVVLLTLFLALILIRRQGSGISRLPRDQEQSRLGPLMLVTVAYIAFLIYTSATNAYDPISDRLLSPVFVPFTVLIAAMVCRALDHLPYKMLWSRVAFFLIAAAIVLSLTHPARVSGELLADVAENGRGYSGESWEHNDTIAYARTELRDWSSRPVYTNNPQALYILADFRMTRSTPWKTADDDVSQLAGSWPSEQDSLVIWLDRQYQSGLFSKQQLETIAVFHPVAELNDGAVYIVDPTTDSD